MDSIGLQKSDLTGKPPQSSLLIKKGSRRRGGWGHPRYNKFLEETDATFYGGTDWDSSDDFAG